MRLGIRRTLQPGHTIPNATALRFHCTDTVLGLLAVALIGPGMATGIATATIGKMEVEKSEAAKEILRLQSEEGDSKSKIEAFAKQAASCDRIKKRLRIKE